MTRAPPRRALLSAGLPVVAAVVLGLPGCSSAPPPPPLLELTVTSGANQNPDAAGRPAPVSVRLYQLASASRFEQADVFALLEHQAETLGPDLLGSEMFVLAPAETRAVRHEVNNGTRLLGVAVLFQDIDNAKWRASAPVASSGPTRLAIAIDRLSVEFGPAKA